MALQWRRALEEQAERRTVNTYLRYPIFREDCLYYYFLWGEVCYVLYVLYLKKNIIITSS